MGFFSSNRRRWHRLAIISFVFCFVLYTIGTRDDGQEEAILDLPTAYPLTWNYVHLFNGTGGAWYIPPEWLPTSARLPRNIVEAAKLAAELASAAPNRNISHSDIPLIIHQTWKNTQVDTWSKITCESIERWLSFAVGVPMAYFLWDDDGVNQMLEAFNPEWTVQFKSLPANVERSDVFRIMVSNNFGGIYGDVDTEPLRSPATWISLSDLEPWVDPGTGVAYRSEKPVKAIFGLEADCPPGSDSYWRMGYTNAVQLAQWTLAAAAGHPVLSRFLQNWAHRLREVSDHHDGDLTSPGAQETLRWLDPLILTGPDAVTLAVQGWLNETVGLQWNALSGLQDGGKSKLVDDIMILPITAFSPGRGVYGNMGSKPISHPDARLLHHAQGSWRSFSLRVEFGKFCRTFLGLCKDWSKV